MWGGGSRSRLLSLSRLVAGEKLARCLQRVIEGGSYATGRAPPVTPLDQLDAIVCYQLDAKSAWRYAMLKSAWKYAILKSNQKESLSVFSLFYRVTISFFQWLIALLLRINNNTSLLSPSKEDVVVLKFLLQSYLLIFHTFSGKNNSWNFLWLVYEETSPIQPAISTHLSLLRPYYGPIRAITGPQGSN